MDPESRFRASSESERGLNAGMSQRGAVWYRAVLRLARLGQPRADVRGPRPADTGGMLRAVNWTARILGFAWITVLAFVVAPPHRALNVPVQIGAFCLAGLAMAAWTLMDLHPAAARYRGRGIRGDPRGHGRGLGHRGHRGRRRDLAGDLRGRGGDGRGR